MSSGGRILVVDDEALNRDLFQQELECLGHRALVAEDGRAALAVLATEPVDLVLLDIMMPGLSGFDVLEQLRADPVLRETPVIVVSALHDLAHTARGIELGAVDYLPKPFEPALLKARIDACLERHRWRAQERAYLDEIERERARADALLEALLPKDAVVEWKASGAVQPRAIDAVAVMFVDIVGFSRTVLDLSPAETVDQLTRFTLAAETLAADAGLEKIKLVGDAMMISGNLLVAHPKPVPACLAVARQLAATARRIGSGWSLRGGLTFGSVVAGVIGRHRFSFDIWGPTVNLAARLAALPEPGVLHLDDAAYRHLGQDLAAEALGGLGLRGVGTTRVYRCSLDGDTRRG